MATPTNAAADGRSPIKFGTSGWRGLIADEFTFANVRLAVTAIAEHVKSKAKQPKILVGYDTRFYSEEFSQLAVDVLQHHGITALLCETFTPTPAVAYEIQRSKLDGAVNFTASHNPAQYHGLKFSSADAGPALPEVTKDIEARSARLFAAGGVPALGQHEKTKAQMVNLRGDYLKRIEELVSFDVLRKGGTKFVVDALHGCGAGYLDKILIDNGVKVEALRTNRDVLFDGTGPDVSEENLAPLRKAVQESKAGAGLATDGDADRFGIVDRDGSWVAPNHVLALVYDYLVETRGWNLPAARSVATSELVDAAARAHGQTTYQTPVGFKYIGQLIREDKIALGGEESSGLTIRGHVPEKDGILACLLVAEMMAARGTSISDQVKALFKKVGREYWPVRENLHLTDEQKKSAIEKSKTDGSTLLGRKVKSVDRTDGAKFAFEDGTWMLLRLSGTEPLLRLYVEAETEDATKRLVKEASEWILKG
ncbi:MAG TPA: phosphoglucomutase/phosphomannomutase family protein [Candidatus Eremiobacteraceae bacterium]|nr:phosphoglucomutase/phosphomannomutase family protein [Candidatus Eremiobacteraceae bacterium]